MVLLFPSHHTIKYPHIIQAAVELGYLASKQYKSSKTIKVKYNIRESKNSENRRKKGRESKERESV